jgi:hypothetical protein
MPVRKILKFGAICLVPVLVAAAWIHNVSTAPTDDDTKYIHAMLEERGVRELVLQGASTFDEEIRTIVAVQDAVLARAPEDKGLPLGSEREPRLLYEARYGLCYDRSRAIEKALTLLGLEVRHLAVYDTDSTGSAVVSLLTPGIGSHAVTEVHTSRGWLIVDSNARWISLDSDNLPWSAADLKRAVAAQSSMPHWSAINHEPMSGIFLEPFVYVPGLYSRHGRFYAPFTPVPDVNWGDLLTGIVT